MDKNETDHLYKELQLMGFDPIHFEYEEENDDPTPYILKQLGIMKDSFFTIISVRK